MKSDKARSAASPASTSVSSRQIQLDALASQVNSWAGHDRIKIARSLLAALIRATDVQSGRFFLTNEEDVPVYCLVLAAGHLQEYSEGTVPPLQEQALAGWAYRQRRAVRIANTAIDTRWAAWRDSPEASAAGSALAVPLLVAGQPLGAVALVADQPNHFSPADLAQVVNLANQAAMVLENARLRTLLTKKQHTIQALQRTTHTISTSQDLAQILHTILRQLTQAVAYPYAVALLQENDQLRPVTALGFDGSERLSERVFNPTDMPAVFQALDQGSTIVAEAETQEIYLGALSFPRPIRLWAIAPLTMRRESLGAIILGSPQARTQDPELIPTITAFADQMAVAIFNHRLAQATNRGLRELAFLSESGQAITSTLDLDRILHLLLDRVRKLLQIDGASIALRDEQTGDLVFEAAVGEGAAGVVGARLKPGQGIAGWVAETGKPLVVQDVYDDARFYAEIDKITGMKTQAILCLPIVLKGQVVGIIEALNPGAVPFDEQVIELLSALAGLAATAIENARLFSRVQSAETRYAGLFEDSANPIIITDLKGTIVDANRNACSLLGQSKEMLYGTNLTLLQSADGKLDFVEPHKQIQAGEEAIFQTEIVRDGQRTIVELKGKEIQLKDTPLIQWIGRDISAEVELERIREDMVRMIIHDLRNPLANIMNSLQVLHDVILEQDESVSQDELLKIATRSGRRMQQLISSILDISRLEKGQAILETEPSDLIPLIQDAIDFVEPQTDIRNMRVTTSFDPDLPQVEIDRDMISRVILNLLDNGIKFTHMGGRIDVTVRSLGSEIEIAITDNGPGIPPDQLQTIFAKFTRVRRKDGPQGTGLGLAFCQLAVKSHGGRIWAESTLGQGSTFRFTLPVHESSSAE